MDELFELLTLTQTGKVGLRIPIVIYGTEFWKKLIDFDFLVESGVIDAEDLSLFRFVDDVDTAFELLRDELTRNFLKPTSHCPDD